MKYLSQVIESLPKNCLFNKGKIGAGGTSLAIESNEPYIICVPFVSLVDNKVAQYPNERRKEPILGVKEGVTSYDIKRYLKSVKCPKIMVTYDSLWKLVKWANPEDFNLLIDEYHLLFKHYSFRSEAVKTVLDNFRKFKSYCFMTATPLEEEFILEELKGIEVVNQDWDDIIPIKVRAVKCNSVKGSTQKVIKMFLSGEEKGNCYLFVNSVSFMKEMIESLSLTEENCRVIYSAHNNTNVGIANGTTLDSPKKINFLSSAVFEGSDIYDEDGRIFVISDPSKEHTLLEVGTSIQQIAGRIRNSKYIGELYHLYNTTNYPDITYKEYKEIVERNVIKEKEAVEQFNAMSDYARSSFNLEDCGYKTFIGNICVFDANRVKIDLYNFKITKGDYVIAANLTDEYIKYNIEVENYSDNTYADKINKVSAGKTFKDTVIEIKNLESPWRELAIMEAKTFFPIIADAIDILGFERIATLNYVQKDIKNELLRLSDKSTANKMIILMRKKISNGLFYSSVDLKEMIQSCYNTLCFKNKKAKATDITNWFNVEEKSKRINGVKVKGYVIINMK